MAFKSRGIGFTSQDHNQNSGFSQDYLFAGHLRATAVTDVADGVTSTGFSNLVQTSQMYAIDQTGSNAERI